MQCQRLNERRCLATALSISCFFVPFQAQPRAMQGALFHQRKEHGYQNQDVNRGGYHAVDGRGRSSCNLRRRSNCAFAATMIVDRLIATAPTLIGRSNPQWTKRPPATGMATTLYAVAQTRFWIIFL